MRSDNLRAAPRWITPSMVGRILALAMPVGGEPIPIKTSPTRGTKPKPAIVESKTPNPPAAPRRLAEEDEAAAVAPHAASPRRPFNPNPTNIAEFANGRAKYNERRKAEAAAKLEAERPLFEIAFDRGIALSDLARALEQELGTVTLHTKQAGFVFGRRPRLADPLTLDQLRALADPTTPLPELLADRGRRLSAEKRNTLKRDRRIDQARENPRYRPLGPRAKPIREVEPAAICRPVDPAPSREPAPRSPARAQPYDSVHRAAAIRRSIERKAAAFVDGDQSSKTSGGRLNQSVRGAVNIIIERRAAEHRLGDPVEQAKTMLRRRHAPVCSMAVHDGDADLFQVGHRKNLTREELLEMAARVAA